MAFTTWKPIRPATEDDHALLNKRAEAFIKRNNIHFRLIDQGIWRDLEQHLNDEILDGEFPEHAEHLTRLWINVFRRAVGVPSATSIGGGYVGRSEPVKYSADQDDEDEEEWLRKYS